MSTLKGFINDISGFVIYKFSHLLFIFFFLREDMIAKPDIKVTPANGSDLSAFPASGRFNCIILGTITLIRFFRHRC